MEAVFNTEIQTGGALEQAGSYFVMYTASDTPPNYGTKLPLILAKMGIVTAKTIVVPTCMMSKQYPIMFAIFTEDKGDKQDKTAAELLDALENLFFDNTLGLSQIVDITSKSYDQTSIPPFSGGWNGSGEMIITHTDTDIREVK